MFITGMIIAANPIKNMFNNKLVYFAIIVRMFIIPVVCIACLLYTSREFEQIYPKPGWVEHNPMEIWSTQYAVMSEAMALLGAKPNDIAVSYTHLL